MMDGTVRSWKEVQLYGWLGFFAYMTLGGHDQTYLAPLQHDILLVGAGLLLLVLVADLASKASDHEQPLGRWQAIALAVESIGHWTPLIVVVLMGVTTLSMDPAILRGGIQMRVLDPNRPPEDMEGALARLRPGEYLETTHIQLYSYPALASDAPVMLIGRISRLQGEAVQEIFPTWDKKENGVVLLYRFAIACCAADASPLAVVLENIPLDISFIDEGWFRVKGITRTLSDESRLVALQVDHFEAIPQPDKPYLSWLDVL